MAEHILQGVAGYIYKTENADLAHFRKTSNSCRARRSRPRRGQAAATARSPIAGLGISNMNMKHQTQISAHRHRLRQPHIYRVQVRRRVEVRRREVRGLRRRRRLLVELIRRRVVRIPVHRLLVWRHVVRVEAHGGHGHEPLGRVHVVRRADTMVLGVPVVVLVLVLRV